MNRLETQEAYAKILKEAVTNNELPATMARLGREDLFFLICHILNRPDINRDWLFDRCREVQKNPNGYLDIWAREHYKSSLITFGLTIQDILNDPEVTIGIFSLTRPIAKGFLRQIKREFEDNEDLKEMYSEILWEKPEHDSPKWSLAIDTPVMTVNGWKNHGDLLIGDKIFGSKGQVITVIGNSGIITNAECREVCFDDCKIVASSEHLWPVQQKKATFKRHTWLDDPEIKIISTDKLPIHDKTQRLPSTPSLQFPPLESSLILDPYILGLWLGDGTAGTNIVSMASEDEEEVLNQIKDAGFTYYVHRKKTEDNFSMYGVKGLKEILLSIGCLKKKHIPDVYLYSPVKERLALLQGLMDSDGTCKGHSTSKGMCMFSNTNKELADSVLYLVTSLGLRPSFCKFHPKQVNHKTIYHVYFVGVKSTPPFRSKRKLNNCKEKRHKTGRYISSINPIESVKVNCIKVDAPDHLYLAGKSMVLTHNSEDDGLIVKRKGNPNASTVEAWGLVDAMPTSKHFNIRVYDDIIDERNVGSPDMIMKATKAWALSQNLGSAAPMKRYKEANISRYVGTRYHFNDPYREIMKRGSAIPRIYPGTEDGTPEGKPVLWDRDFMAMKRRDLGPFVFSCLPSDAPILMSDWSFKNISDIEVGENVIGLVKGNFHTKKNKSLVISTVLAKQKQRKMLQKVTLGNGETIFCTKNHKWWAGRWTMPSDKWPRHEYRQLSLDHSGLGALSKICDVPRTEFNRVKVVAIEDAGVSDVYDIQTTTGNFVAYGYVSSNCQILCNPVADEAQGFKRDWIRHYKPDGFRNMNLYLICDPAGEKKKTNDYTVMLVIGLGDDRNYYLVDGLRDRLNLTERTKAYFYFMRKYNIIGCGYEKYGKDSDIEHIEETMQKENYRFEIISLGGNIPKFDRIRKLIPLFESHRFYIPEAIYYKTCEGKVGNLVNDFLDTEYDAFPVAIHDDIMDCMARIRDEALGAKFPLSRGLRESIDIRNHRRRQQEYDPFAQLSAM